MSSAAVAVRAVEALLRELEAADKFSGVVGVEQGEQTLLLEAFGYASRTWRIPATVDTRFDSASITKLFTAVATLQLLEHGAFTLDTSVMGYLGLEETGVSSAVTPYHLLTHTSGIADDADEEAGERLRGSLSRAAQLLDHGDGGLPPPVRRQATQLCTRRGLPLLQRRLCAARPDDRAGQRIDLPRVRDRARLRPGGDANDRGSSAWTSSNRMWPRAWKRSRMTTVASVGGAETSTPTHRSVALTAVHMPPFGDLFASTGPWPTDLLVLLLTHQLLSPR